MVSIVSKTNNERRLSIYTPLTYVFSNKYTIFLKDSLDTYLNAFSPDLLFIHGDNKYLFSVYQHGVFYLIDFLFILIGFGSLFAKNKKVLLLLGSLTLISPLPSVVSNLGISYAIRSMLLAPLLCIFGGVGIWETINFTKKKYKTFISLLIVLIYFLSFLNFLNIYLFRNPIYNSESFSFSSRILVKYLSFTTKPVYVVDLNPRTPLKQYLFYTNSLNNKNKDTIANSFLTKDYRLNNIVFLNCKDLKNIKQNSVIVTNDLKCKNLPITNNYLNIVQLSDSGTIYKIYNDNICSNFSLSKYVANIKLSDLNVEDLSKEDFCQKFIIKF